MKQHSTNYFNTFIEAADDCPLTAAQEPPCKEPKTAARIEYETLIGSPYKFTSDDVLYESNGRRRGISREDFFSKGQPCFRASALGKRYGWGIHCDNDGRIAMFAIESDEYKRFLSDETVKRVKAMKPGSK